MDMGSETTMGMDVGSDTTMAMGDGEMGMRPVEFVDLPAGVAVELKPGGYHIMFIDLVKPLEVGTTISLTLVFEKAGEVVIDVPVLDEAP
jgi:copper(I)-binding protein